MLHELQRRNYSPSTIRSYLGAVQQFAEHFHCSPERLGPEHLRRYQVFLLQEKGLEPSTVEIRISALRFLYKRTLRRRDLALDDLIFPKVPHKLPTVLSQEEVARLIDAAPNRLYRMILVLLYATLKPSTSPVSFARCIGKTGSSMPSPRSAAPRMCSIIWLVTPTGSPSPTTGCFRSLLPKSIFTGRTMPA